MPTRPFLESLKERAAADPEFGAAVLAEAAACFINGELSVAKSMLRDYVKATIGFEALGAEIDKHPSSLKRMLSEKGNPTAANLAALLVSLKTHEGGKFEVELTH